MPKAVRYKPGRRARAGAPPSAGATPTTTLEKFFPLLLLIVTVLVYIPALRAGYIWDDDRYVTENQELRSLGGLLRIWTTPGATPQYYPLVFTTFWLEFQLWGLRPFGYHLVNVLLHVGNALLLWRLLRRLSVPGAIAAAALWALHPVAVESVAWITERKNVLSGLFYLLSLNALVRWYALDREEPDARCPRGWKLYAAAFAFYIAALLSKTVTSTLPAAMLVLVWWKRGRLSLRRDVLPVLPMLAVGAALSFVTVWMERVVVGTAERDWSLTPLQRLLTAGNAFWFYLWKLLVPADLAFIYPRWEMSLSNLLHWLAPLAFFALVAGLWALRGRTGRGPLAAVLLFAGTLTPALGFFDVYPFEFSFVADHFQYLAMAWMLALVAAGYALVPRRLGPGAAISMGLILLVLAVQTARQAVIYESAETLWRDTIGKNPTSPMPRTNLGQILAATGRAPEAIPHYEAAIAANRRYGIAHFNLGAALAQTGQVDRARLVFQQALAVDPKNAQMHYHVGLGLQRIGEEQQAVERFAEAVRLKPNFVDPLNDWANSLAQQGRMEDAIAKYREVLRIKPDYVVARSNLANALAVSGQPDAALEEYKVALKMDPLNAGTYFNYGLTLEGLGHRADARQQFETALKLEPGRRDAQEALTRLPE